MNKHSATSNMKPIPSRVRNSGESLVEEPW